MTPATAYQSVVNEFNETPSDNGIITEDEVYNYLWEAECELNRYILCAETSSTSTSTVSGTQEYAKPTGCLVVTRVLWDSDRLKRIGFREMESLDSAGGTSTTGDPIFYYEYGDNLGLYPTPTSAAVLKIYYVVEPTQLTQGSHAAFTVPAMFHHYFKDYALYRMFAKDQDQGRANYFKAIWDQNLEKAKHEFVKMRKKDRLAVVQDEESMASTDWGMV